MNKEYHRKKQFSAFSKQFCFLKLRNNGAKNLSKRAVKTKCEKRNNRRCFRCLANNTPKGEVCELCEAWRKAKGDFFKARRLFIFGKRKAVL